MLQVFRCMKINISYLIFLHHTRVTTSDFLRSDASPFLSFSFSFSSLLSSPLHSTLVYFPIPSLHSFPFTSHPCSIPSPSHSGLSLLPSFIFFLFWMSIGLTLVLNAQMNSVNQKRNHLRCPSTWIWSCFSFLFFWVKFWQPLPIFGDLCISIVQQPADVLILL